MCDSRGDCATPQLGYCFIGERDSLRRCLPQISGLKIFNKNNSNK